MQQLLKYLGSINQGELSEPAELESPLAACWHQFRGTDAAAMGGYKLLGRIEEACWMQPILRLVIERHGGAALGSTRAELQEWMLNINERTATCQIVGHRQVQPKQANLDVGPLAEQITELISNQKPDHRLRWKADGTVQVLIVNILPANSALKQTLEGRRRMFRKKLGGLLNGKGWQQLKANLFAPPTT